MTNLGPWLASHHLRAHQRHRDISHSVKNRVFSPSKQLVSISTRCVSCHTFDINPPSLLPRQPVSSQWNESCHCSKLSRLPGASSASLWISQKILCPFPYCIDNWKDVHSMSDWNVQRFLDRSERSHFAFLSYRHALSFFKTPLNSCPGSTWRTSG